MTPPQNCHPHRSPPDADAAEGPAVRPALSPRDTIAAIATPPGRGGIGVVRLSGPDSKQMAAALIQNAVLEDHRAHFTRILDRDGHTLDEAVVTYFPGPRSYTGDDVVEISAHGAPVLLEWLVRECIARGARLARAGEFTERAFLAGRLDLTQAEAVRDLIDSTTLEQARVAARQLGGAVAGAVRPVKAALVTLIGTLEAGIDFAEDDLEVAPTPQIEKELGEIAGKLEALAASYRFGRVLRDGVTLAIAGRPNAGKSSLFNRLVRRDRAIVTAMPGTTRDLVTETLSLGGIPVHLVDTAGLREAADEAEAIGIAKSREALAEADLVLLVLDASAEDQTGEERELLADQWLAPRRVTVLNKCDLLPGEGLQPHAVVDSAGAPASQPLQVSALTGAGLDSLRQLLKDKVTGAGADTDTPLTSLRQQQAVATAAAAALRGLTAAGDSLPHEVLLIDLYAALQALDELTGATTNDDILALIFSTFCIGK